MGDIHTLLNYTAKCPSIEQKVEDVPIIYEVILELIRMIQPASRNQGDR